MDSFLLARFARFRPEETVCDLGAGSGILGLLALERGKAKRVLAVEIQRELADHLEANAGLLGVTDRLDIYCGDWKQIPKKFLLSKFDVVVSNPPYRKLKSGKVPPNASKAAAKHEIHGSMGDLVSCARKLLKPSGRFCVLYPPLRLEELVLELKGQGFKVQRLACIHPYEDRPATHVMVEAVRSAVRELKVESPVVVYQDAEHYRPDVEAWVGRKRRV